MTDDEIDAAIRAIVPAECFRANAGARAIYRAGYIAGIEAAAKVCDRRILGDLNREEQEAKRCADMIRGLLFLAALPGDPAVHNGRD